MKARRATFGVDRFLSSLDHSDVHLKLTRGRGNAHLEHCRRTILPGGGGGLVYEKAPFFGMLWCFFVFFSFFCDTFHPNLGFLACFVGDMCVEGAQPMDVVPPWPGRYTCFLVYTFWLAIFFGFLSCFLVEHQQFIAPHNWDWSPHACSRVQKFFGYVHKKMVLLAHLRPSPSALNAA